MENNNNNENIIINSDFGDLYKESDIRKAKIEMLENSGVVAYKNRFERTHRLAEAAILEDGESVKVAGRVVGKRVMGKFSFMHLYDIDGRLQVSLSSNDLDEEKYTFFKKMIDMGDFVGVEGEVYTTKTGAKTVKVMKFDLLSKAILPLPEKWHGLTDTEARYKQRYLDIIANEKSREVLLTRSKLLSFIRRYLENHGFMEVETPILQDAVCGANAKPFITKHNALDKECNLRIAPETYLKQVIAAGFDRVFEVSKCFRNEGMDATHLQEFTQVEWYASYWDVEDNAKFFNKFFRDMCYEITGEYAITIDGNKYELKETFDRIDYTATLSENLGFDILEETDVKAFIKKVGKSGKLDEKEFENTHTVGGAIDLCYKRLVRPSIIEPTILFNYPNIVPLARPSDADGRTIEMIQLLIDGVELCKAYSELVDPKMQRENLVAQLDAKKLGDDEAMDVDEGFLKAMEHGMPPISGLGMGIDRLLMLMYDCENIRDTILFPIMGDKK